MNSVEDKNAFIAESLDLDLLIRHALEQGLLEEAGDAIDSLIEADPSHHDGWFLKGVHGLLRGDPAGARAWFAAALSRGADRRAGRLGLAQAQAGAGDVPQAWTTLLELAQDEPSDAEVLHWLLRVGSAQESWEELAGCLQRYLAICPSDHAARFALAGVCVRAGRLDRAREQYQLLRERQPDLEGLADLDRWLEPAPLVASAA